MKSKEYIKVNEWRRGIGNVKFVLKKKNKSILKGKWKYQDLLGKGNKDSGDGNFYLI